MLNLLALLACAPSPDAQVRSTPTWSAPPHHAPPTASFRTKLDDLVGGAADHGGGLMRIGRPSTGFEYRYATGNAWRGGPAMVVDDAFEIASISKTFTAAVVLLMAEDGLVALEDPIGDHLPLVWGAGLLEIDGHDHGPELTLRQLLQHTAGLPDYWYDPPFVAPHTNAWLRDFNADPDKIWAPEEILAYAAELNPISAPGGGWHYSDTGFLMIGLMIERIEGEPLHAVYRRRILDPLGMDQTWLPWHDAPIAGQRVSHRYEGRDDLWDVPRQSADWAGGGLVSDARDLSDFSVALHNGALFADPGSHEALLTTVPTAEADVAYGLGIYELDLGAKGTWWGHEGYGEAWMWYWPDKGASLTGTLNQTESYWWPLGGRILMAAP
jgi:D-alanyl-D-alanine carboxypeptidase